jgi:hypothetical protein
VFVRAPRLPSNASHGDFVTWGSHTRPEQTRYPGDQISSSSDDPSQFLSMDAFGTDARVASSSPVTTVSGGCARLTATGGVTDERIGR